MTIAGSHTAPESELRGFVDRIHTRFFDRIGDRLTETLTAEELSAEVLCETLYQADAAYGCFIRLKPTEAQAGSVRSDPIFALDAVISKRGSGQCERISDELQEGLSDAFTENVLATGKAVYSNSLLRGSPAVLPRQHPPVHNFAILPLRNGPEITALLLLANTEQGFDQDTIDRLQSMLDRFSRTELSRLVNHELQRLLIGGERNSGHVHDLLSSSFNGILTMDETGIITSFNPACEQLFGVSTVIAVGQPLKNFIAESALRSILKHSEEYKDAPRSHARKYRCRDVQGIRANGEYFSLDIMVCHSHEDPRTATTFILRDISEQLKRTRELRAAVNQLDTLTRLAPVGIIELGGDWTCIYANDMWCQLSQLKIEETLNTGWIDAIFYDDVVKTLISMRDALGSGHTYRQELRLQSPSGDTTWVSMSAMGLYDEYDRLSGSHIVFIDINEQQLASEKLRQIAQQDELTGLLNRAHFIDLLESDLQQCGTHRKIALLYIDLDGFKQVNDTYGHILGDELLRQVAIRLRNAVREEDRVARLGGDEFIVTLTHLRSGRFASIVAEKIIDQIRLPFTVHSQQVCVTASIGITTGDHSSEGRDVLIKQADIALFRAKESGRSRYIFYTPALDQVRRARSLLVGSIRHAVDRRNFALHYQPQLLVDGQTLFGFEALLRWPEQSGAMIAIDTLIDVMESTGLIDEVGQWVLREACEQYMQWFDAGLIASGTKMSVNVSARQLGMAQFVNQVDAILQRCNMPPSHLVLEITESTLVETLESDVLHKLKSLGVQISLDDFGTGYSSLAYISQLPLDHLKVDRSFIANVTRSRRAVTVVKSIIALARTLGINVIAEGVEDASVLPLLQAEGCVGFQGYHVSHPVPGNSIPGLLAALSRRDPSEDNAFIDLGDPGSVQDIA